MLRLEGGNHGVSYLVAAFVLDDLTVFVREFSHDGVAECNARILRDVGDPGDIS